MSDLEFSVDVKKKKKKVKKVSMEWSDDDIILLIKNVEIHECLWNAQVEEYKNKKARYNAWKEVALEFDEKIPESELCAKWSNLRIQYKSYHAKARKKTSVHWRFYNHMAFLARAENNQSTPFTSNLSLGSAQSIEDDVEATKSSNSSAAISKKRKISATSSNHDCKTVAFNDMKRAFKKMDEYDHKNDSFQIFANYVAEELRNIPNKDQAKRIQHKLTRNLLDYLDEVDTFTSVMSSRNTVISWLQNCKRFKPKGAFYRKKT